MSNLSVLRSTAPLLRHAATACLVLGLAHVVGCDEPPVDSSTPTPKGVIEGSMLYVGPRPVCTYEGGVAIEVTGRVLLTIINHENPLPPEGTATTPIDFLAVGGEDVFALTDCLPENATIPDQQVVIMKTANFRWTDLPLANGAGATINYRISGFYDQEGDFNPLFSVAQTTTRGDIAGAALQNASAPNPQFRLITFGSVEDNPLGVKVTGVALTFGGYVQTEPPVFYVEDGDIDSSGPFFPMVTYPTIQLSLFSRDPNEARRVEMDTLLGALNFDGFVDYSNHIAYAWYVEQFDLDRSGTNADDLHPVLGSLGIGFRSPYVFLQRVRNDIELATGVPTVAIIPFVDDAETRHVLYPTVVLEVANVAAMVVNPANPACTAVLAPDGSPAAFYAGSGQSATECAELPTGYYGVNALSGVVGGTMTPMGVGAGTSQTGADITGGQFGSQVWRIPNEFGDCRQLGGGPDCTAEGGLAPVASQGLTGGVVVHDSDEAGPNGRRETGGQAGVCAAPTFADFPVGNEVCCAPVAHLCDVPLCAFEDAAPAWGAGTTYRVRGVPTSTVVDPDDGIEEPNCMPFALPLQCCGEQATSL